MKIRRILKEFWEECAKGILIFKIFIFTKILESVAYKKFLSMATTLEMLESKINETLTEIIKNDPYNVSALRAMGVFEARILNII